MSKLSILVEKNDGCEGPIPDVWRGMFIAIIDAFAEKNYQLYPDLENVLPVSASTAKHICSYIEDYGEELVPLPEQTWETSVCIWDGLRWNVMVDLWTKREGRSDLVLGANVIEKSGEYIVEVGIVYVP